ncbi:Hypothetical protein A7982_10807 [Minicystis rosea]|nr:Hypothetical protein A7982_10807 [Minicystis rosea]
MSLKATLGTVAVIFATFAAGCGSTSNLVDDGKAVASIEITPSTETLTKGATLQLRAVLEYADGTSKDITESADTVWNTSDADIATVTDDGMVTGVSEGFVDVSASYKGEKANEHFAVTP